MLTMSKKEADEIRRKYDTVLFHTEDAVNALNFVHDFLCAEADAIRRKYPFAAVSISDLEKAAYQVFSLSGDLDGERFEEDEVKK